MQKPFFYLCVPIQRTAEESFLKTYLFYLVFLLLTREDIKSLLWCESQMLQKIFFKKKKKNKNSNGCTTDRVPYFFMYLELLERQRRFGAAQTSELLVVIFPFSIRPIRTALLCIKVFFVIQVLSKLTNVALASLPSRKKSVGFYCIS